MNTPNDWLRHASCRNHPVLKPDAWFQIEKGFPRKDGAAALLVCRRVCPVRLECRAWVTSEINTIAGGGWFGSRGDYQEPKSDLYDANMAAAFLGVTLERIQRLGRKRLPVAHKERGRSWYHETDVWALAETLSPVHGTEQALRLHHIRGERPCQRCQAPGISKSPTETTGPTGPQRPAKRARRKGSTGGSVERSTFSRDSEEKLSVST